MDGAGGGRGRGDSERRGMMDERETEGRCPCAGRFGLLASPPPLTVVEAPDMGGPVADRIAFASVASRKPLKGVIVEAFELAFEKLEKSDETVL